MPPLVLHLHLRRLGGQEVACALVEGLPGVRPGISGLTLSRIVMRSMVLAPLVAERLANCPRHLCNS